jgi:hypothetical protein
MMTAVMKILKQFLMAAAFVILASTMALAQKQDEKKPKPKENPPEIVVPKDKKPPRDNDRPPRDERKKPQGDFMDLVRTEEFSG